MGKRGWRLAVSEGTVPPNDKLQRIPYRLSPHPSVKGGVVSLMNGGATSSGWFRPPGDMGTYPVESLERRQYPPQPPPPDSESTQ